MNSRMYVCLLAAGGMVSSALGSLLEASSPSAPASVDRIASSPPPMPQAGDYTIPTFENELINGGRRTVERYYGFPVEGRSWGGITMDYHLSCPPGGCDPWDRSATVYLITEDDLHIELARLITPYKKACSWSADVTPYMPLLRGDVKLGIFIDTWVWEEGWQVTVDFTFHEGLLEPEPYRVEPLWRGSPEMGSYQAWLEGRGINEDFFTPWTLGIPAEAVETELRFSMTGHGQGNSRNAGEFIQLGHWVEADGETIASRVFWRDDCAENPCSPQSGTWKYSRAGWCPGDVAPMWSVDLTPHIGGADSVTVDYGLDEYVNYCSPANPECDPDRDCMYWINSCDYDGGGHTPPSLWTESQVVYYRSNPLCDLALEIPAPPTTVESGERVTVEVFARNACAAPRSFDRAELAFEGRVSKRRILYEGPSLKLPAGARRGADVTTVIPANTPPGDYSVTISLLREEVEVGFASFPLTVE